MAHTKRLSGGQARLGAVTTAGFYTGARGVLRKKEKKKSKKQRKTKARYFNQGHYPQPAKNPAGQQAIDIRATEQPRPASSLVEALNLGHSSHSPRTRTDAGLSPLSPRPGPPDTHLSAQPPPDTAGPSPPRAHIAPP